MSLNILLSDGVLRVPDWVRESLDAFREWAGSDDLPEQARVDFVRGDVWIDLSRQQIFTHVEVRTAITATLHTLAQAGELGLYLSSGALVTNVRAGWSGNPDGTFISNNSRASNRVTFTPGATGGYVEVVGTPDMVLEVVSDSSEKKDNQTLFEAYYETGIPEYWLVDARGPELEFTIYRHSGKKYTATRSQPGGWVKSTVFGKAFRLVRGTDSNNKPEFTLEVK